MQQTNMQKTISQAQMSLLVRGKDKLYDAMGRSGWAMPSKGCPLCTLDFIHGVRKGTFYCPKTSDSAGRKKCYSRPPAKIFDLVRVFFRRPKAASEILRIDTRVFWRPKTVSDILRCGTVVSNHLKETVVPIITLSHLRQTVVPWFGTSSDKL